MASDMRAHRAAKVNAPLFRPESMNLTQMALTGKMFDKGKLTDQARRQFQDKAKASAFLHEAEEDSDNGIALRNYLETYGVELYELREWLESQEERH